MRTLKSSREPICPLRRKLLIVGDSFVGKVKWRGVIIIVHSDVPLATIDIPPSHVRIWTFPRGEVPSTEHVFHSLRKIQRYIMVHENHVHDITVDGQQVELAAWDSHSHEEFDRLRDLNYAGTHVILLAFSVDMPGSLQNAQEKACAFPHTHLPAFHCIRNLQN
jgi:GTPase SAR1 family protein